MDLKAVVAEKTRDLAALLTVAMSAEKEEDRTKAFAEAFAGFAENVEASVNEKTETALAALDNKIMAKRGMRDMTSAEIKFGEKLKASLTSANPNATVTDLEKAFPETIITTVLEDVRTDHRLLEVIDFQNTSVVTKMIFSKGISKLAKWGPLNEAFTKELSGAIDSIDVTFCKLSAFLPIPKDMLEVSPAWLVNLIMMILEEACANGLEDGILNGSGKDMPIGMRKDMKGAVIGGIYPNKDAVKLTSFAPAEYGAIVAKLARTEENQPRKVNKVIFVCNSVDYLTKVFPATTLLTPNGTYAQNIFPYPTEVVQTEYLNQGEAIIGIPERYFMGVGMSKSGRIEFSDHAQFLEDVRLYTIKMLGNGKPKDNNAFILLDISDLRPMNLKVELTGGDISASVTLTEAEGLTSLTIGSLELTPAFDPDVTEYTVNTTNAQNTIKATAPGKDIEIKVNAVPQTNNTAAVWHEGENVVEITVSGITYIITVNKS